MAMKHNPLPRLDKPGPAREAILPHCRLKPGEIWDDPLGRHRIGCLDATNPEQVTRLIGPERPVLAVHDPPYNQVAFEQKALDAYIDWCALWVRNTAEVLDDNAAMYVWLGADQNKGFQPLPDFMLMMRRLPVFKTRSYITVRNQRGYGTQKNWMAVRQELLHYIKGDPSFTVQYTGIPKILRGYYKEVEGKTTENLERGKSPNIRPGNVWVDIQQVFYRMQENVSGCFAQKPLSAIDRIVLAGSRKNDWVIDFFAHAGTTLLSCEMHERRCYTMDVDPVYAEITIRRLEHFRDTGQTGWQNENPFMEVFPAAT